jgi:hypothetical protein
MLLVIHISLLYGPKYCLTAGFCGMDNVKKTVAQDLFQIMNQFENVISWDKGLLIVIITIRVRQSTYFTQEYVTQSEKCFIPLIYNAMEESLSKSQMYIINRCEQDTKQYPVSQNITCLTTSIRMIFSSNYIQQKEGRMITKFLIRPIISMISFFNHARVLEGREQEKD